MNVGLHKEEYERTNVEVSGLRGFSRSSARLPGWADNCAGA